MRALGAVLALACAAAYAGEVTVIRPVSFIGADSTYYIALDGQPLRDIETRQNVRFDVPSGRHALAVRCPKAMSLTYAETRVDEDFEATPAFFVIEPRYDCVTLRRIDARAAAPLLGNTALRTDQANTFRQGRVQPSAEISLSDRPAADPAGAVAAGDVAALTAAWVDAFNSRDPARIVALYDPQAVLIGTSAKQPAVGTAAIAAYFREAPNRPMNRVALGEHTARRYGDIAIDSGLYNFFAVRDGKATLIPARYTFVYRQRGGTWLIVEHHSSRVP